MRKGREEKGTHYGGSRCEPVGRERHGRNRILPVDASFDLTTNPRVMAHHHRRSRSMISHLSDAHSRGTASGTVKKGISSVGRVAIMHSYRTWIEAQHQERNGQPCIKLLDFHTIES